MTKEIIAIRGQRILVDDEDYDALNQYRWAVNVTGHAVRKIKCEIAKDGRRWIGMHRQIMGLPAGTRGTRGHVEVDHINGIRLDNRRSNLRICTRAENVMNRRGNGRTGLKGVTFNEQTGLYSTEICRGNTRKYLGSYKSAKEAHEVYCLWADMLHGEFANHGHLRDPGQVMEQIPLPPREARISIRDVEQIRSMKGQVSAREIAAQYGISMSYVFGILNGSARSKKEAT